MSAAIAAKPVHALYWMALGTFAIGTEGFMIAPLLPKMAEELSVSLITAGQLVTVFTLSYAFSSPILTALTGDIGRRNLLNSFSGGLCHRQCRRRACDRVLDVDGRAHPPRAGRRPLRP